MVRAARHPGRRIQARQQVGALPSRTLHALVSHAAEADSTPRFHAWQQIPPPAPWRSWLRTWNVPATNRVQGYETPCGRAALRALTQLVALVHTLEDGTLRLRLCHQNQALLEDLRQEVAAAFTGLAGIVLGHGSGAPAPCWHVDFMGNGCPRPVQQSRGDDRWWVVGHGAPCSRHVMHSCHGAYKPITVAPDAGLEVLLLQAPS